MARKITKPKPKPATPSPKNKPAARKKPAAHSPAAEAPTSAPGSRMKPPTKGVTVRMYRTGLGDCFLLAFPKAKTAKDARDAFYLLIDCGVFKATPDGGARIKKIVQDIKVATAGRIDLLAVTHEHWDHVSGFHPSQARDVFEEIELGTLWMAWTEDQHNALAKQLGAARHAARQALTQALTQMHGHGLTAQNSDTASLINKVLDFFGPHAGDDLTGSGAGNVEPRPDAASALGMSGDTMGAAADKGGATGEAMRWLREEYGKGKVQYLHPGDGPLPFAGVADARVYVLGPPEDATLIKRSNPTAKGDEVYPKAMAAALEASFFAAFGVIPTHADAFPTDDDVAEARRMCLPFDERYQVNADAAKQDDFFKANYFGGGDAAWRRIDADWLEGAGEFALQLDSATNNTSLAFAIEIGPPGEGQVLLFPGDAQVGNWLSWFGKVEIRKEKLGKDMVWKVGGKTVDAKDLLARTVLYKVGHHGSHNATLRAEGLQLMGRPDGSGGLVAMIPVDEFVAHKKAGYGDMPLPSLVQDLLVRTGGRVARNDEDAPIDPGTHGGNPTLKGVSGAPARLENFGTKVKTDLYIEYTFG